MEEDGASSSADPLRPMGLGTEGSGDNNDTSKQRETEGGEGDEQKEYARAESLVIECVKMPRPPPEAQVHCRTFRLSVSISVVTDSFVYSHTT